MLGGGDRRHWRATSVTAAPAFPMSWLYRLQSRVNLTGAEGTAIVVLALALAGGAAARYVVASTAPPPPALYAPAGTTSAPTTGTPATVPLVTPVAAVSAPDPLATSGAPAAEAFALPEEDVHAASASGGDASAASGVSEAALVAQAVVELSEQRSAARSGRKPPPVPTNLNSGSFEELQRLPRVGPAMAARIIAYRQEVGPFRRPEDIMEVRGIGERTFEQMAPWIRL